MTYDTVEDALENGVPSIPEITELVRAELAGADKTFADVLEDDDAQGHEDDENEEEYVAGEEDVGDFNVGHEPDSLDTLYNNRLGSFGICRVVGAGKEAAESVQGALRDLHRGDVELRKVGRWSTTGGPLVPGCEGLQEAHANDTHAPLEVLGPGSHDGWHLNGGHADKGLGLKIAKQGQSVRGDVCGRVRMTETGDDGGNGESKACSDGYAPCDALLIDGLAVRQVSFDACQRLSGGRVDPGLDLYVKVGNVVDGVGHFVDGTLRNLGIRREVDVASAHRAQAFKRRIVARIDRLFVDREPVCDEVELERHVSRDLGHAIDVDRQRSIVRGEDDVEKGG